MSTEFLRQFAEGPGRRAGPYTRGENRFRELLDRGLSLREACRTLRAEGLSISNSRAQELRREERPPGRRRPSRTEDPGQGRRFEERQFGRGQRRGSETERRELRRAVQRAARAHPGEAPADLERRVRGNLERRGIYDRGLSAALREQTVEVLEARLVREAREAGVQRTRLTTAARRRAIERPDSVRDPIRRQRRQNQENLADRRPYSFVYEVFWELRDEETGEVIAADAYESAVDYQAPVQEAQARAAVLARERARLADRRGVPAAPLSGRGKRPAQMDTTEPIWAGKGEVLVITGAELVRLYLGGQR